MQINYLHNNVYRLYRYARPQENLDYYRQLYEPLVQKWQRLKKEKVDDKVIAQVLGISRATYYRYKEKLNDLAKGIVPPTTKPHTFRKSQVSQDLKDLVLQLRRENPTYGKAKIAVIIERDYGMYTSESTVGRVLKYFMNKGLVTRSRSATRAKRKRAFKKHAQRWKYTMKPQKQGEMIQIDHMTVTKNSITVKHFQAWDPTTKVMLAEVYSNATSRTAKRFLNKVVDELPFPVKSIQVDGGSEFMRDFENDCKDREIPLYVLPPCRPQYNGGVERGNRIMREEFYARNDLIADSVGAMRFELGKAIKKHNSFRPHHSLKGMTPFEYTQRILEGSDLSHM